jgi:hypothetical protein
MPSIRKSLFLLLSIAAARGAAKDLPKFKPDPAASYPTHQTVDNLTIAAVPYQTDEETQTAFGKVNPNKYGILPVLVVMQNDSKQVLRLDSMRVEYIRADHTSIDATPSKEVPYVIGPKRPSMTPSPIPGIKRKRKNPLDAWAIDGRAFAARMLPPGESANGFFYFQVAHRPGAKVYLKGIRVASSGKELFYFEIPLEEQ